MIKALPKLWKQSFHFRIVFNCNSCSFNIKKKKHTFINTQQIISVKAIDVEPDRMLRATATPIAIADAHLYFDFGTAYFLCGIYVVIFNKLFYILYFNNINILIKYKACTKTKIKKEKENNHKGFQETLVSVCFVTSKNQKQKIITN